MILPYGLKDGQLIHISEAKSGITDLQCPYCLVFLYAKKGKVMAHHFAHTGNSCINTNANLFFALGLSLPCQLTLHEFVVWIYRKINLRHKVLQKQQRWLQQEQNHLQGKLRLNMQLLKQQNLNAIYEPERQQLYQQIKDFLWNEHQPFPMLSTAFQSQFPNLITLLQHYHPNRYKLLEVNQQIELYQQDFQRFRRFSLYFLKIRSGDYRVFYKIGLTSRPMSERLAEIQTNLDTIFEQPNVEVLYQLQDVAFLELFFKQKFKPQQYPIANFTEYFRFEAFEVKQIVDDFKRIESYLR
jgi:hypothetical protein